MIDAKELLQLQEKIKEGQRSLIELNAKRDTLLEQLKSKFGCDTLAEAKKLIASSEKELRKEEDKLDELYRELTEIMESL